MEEESDALKSVSKEFAFLSEILLVKGLEILGISFFMGLKTDTKAVNDS